MTQKKYTALPAFPFIISSHSTSYVVVGADSHGRSTLVPLSETDSRKEIPIYKHNMTLDRILEALNEENSFTLTMNAPQEEAVPETPVAKGTPALDSIVIRVDTTEVEQALCMLTELEASITRVRASLE